MRKIYSFLFALFLLAGCTKDNNNDNQIPGLSATVDNAAWNAFTIDTHIMFTIDEYEVFYIRAVTKDEHELIIKIAELKSGNYSFAQNQFWATYCAYPNYETDLSSSGVISLKVDSLNQVISGTFDFILKNINNSSDSVVITNGTFNNLRYTYLNKK